MTTTAAMKPSSEYEAFVAATLANPEDVGPRLMLADWLEQHGDHVATACHRQEFPSGQGALSLATSLFVESHGRFLALPVPDLEALRRAEVGAERMQYDEEMQYDVAVYVWHGFVEVVACSLYFLVRYATAHFRGHPPPLTRSHRQISPAPAGHPPTAPCHHLGCGTR